MCGIAGFLDLSGKVSAEALSAASRAIAHRGPDDSGVKIIQMSDYRGRVGLANRRLAILDLSAAGHQPMLDPETGNWIAYNGEVYNFAVLRRELELLGAHATSLTDTEVVLKAYAQWGESCLERFRGMFALAIWDASRQRMFLARDRLGKKPLYYYQGQDFLLFASEVRALLATGLVPQRIDESALEQFLTFGSLCHLQTLIAGVRSLPPASCMTWQGGSLEIREYWDMSTRCTEPPANEAVLVSRLRSLLHESMDLRMVSDVPVGVFLSGGIDSSALVGLLSETGREKINTFSVVFKDLDYSEAEFSRLIARRFKTEHREIELTARDFLQSVPEAIRAMDQPSVDGFNTFIISREVRRAGLKVALSGQGGDELFCGYQTFQTVPSMERFLRTCKRLPSPMRRVFTSAFLANGRSDRTRKLDALITGNGSVLHPYFLTRMVFVPSQQKRLLLKSPTSDAANDLRTLVSRAQSLDPVNRVSYFELKNYLANTLLRDADCMSMAHGLEVRMPLLDHNLVEYVLSIPGKLKLDRQTPKHLLVKAMSGLLPKKIVYRPKQGFTFPFEYWLRAELRPNMEAVLNRIGEGPLASLLSSDAVKEVWQEFLDGRTSWSRPWSLYVLARWCEVNFSTIQDSELALA